MAAARRSLANDLTNWDFLQSKTWNAEQNKRQSNNTQWWMHKAQDDWTIHKGTKLKKQKNTRARRREVTEQQNPYQWYNIGNKKYKLNTNLEKHYTSSPFRFQVPIQNTGPPVYQADECHDQNDGEEVVAPMREHPWNQQESGSWERMDPCWREPSQWGLQWGSPSW